MRNLPLLHFPRLFPPFLFLAVLVAPAFPSLQAQSLDSAHPPIYNPSPGFDRIKVLDFLQNQQFGDAISYLQPLLSLDSTNIQAISYLGYAQYMNDNRPAAEAAYGRVLRLDPTNIGALQYLTLLSSRQSPLEALSYTHRLLRLQPDHAAHYRTAAELNNRIGWTDTAMALYQRAYALDPSDYRNAAGLATQLIERKEYLPADSILDAALLLDSNNVTCLKLRTLSAYESKAYAEALDPGERLLRMGEPAIAAMTQLALSYYNLKGYPDCIRVCEYMAVNQLATESTFYYEAKACVRIREYEHSDQLLRTCLAMAISSTAELYYYNLGSNFEEQHQYRAAIAAYDTAFYLFRNPMMKYNCGRIYDGNLHNQGLARKYYHQYLAFGEPNAPDEKKAYAYVKRLLHHGLSKPVKK
jgi:tetratricopeptide (TPR) repeat protein